MTTGRTLANSERELLAARQRTRELEEHLSILRAKLRLLSRSHAETHRRAHFDSLAGLPNRLLPLDRFQQAVAHARRLGTNLALLDLDIDGLKAVNDTLGHATDDGLLKRVAARLKACIGGCDTGSRENLRAWRSGAIILACVSIGYGRET